MMSKYIEPWSRRRFASAKFLDFLAVFQMGSLDCKVLKIAAAANPPLQRVHLQVEAHF